QYQQWKIPANCAAKVDFQEKNIGYRMTNPVSVLQERCCYLSYWLQAAESKWFKKEIGFDVLPEVRGLFFMESIPGDGEIPAEADKIFSTTCSLSKKTEWQEMIDQGSSSLVNFITGLSPVVSGVHEIRREDLDRWARKLAEKIVDVEIQDQWLDFRKEDAEEFKFDQILLSGFKIYEIEREISFKPITIMLGKNNSGKSTIIQALLLLKQSSENLRKGIPLKFHGPYWDLGNHENCCYNKDTKIPIQFRLTFKNQLGQQRAFGFEFSADENNQSVLRKLEYYESPGTTETERTEFPLYTFVWVDQSKKLVLIDNIDSEHPAWAKKVSELHRQIKAEKINESILTENPSLIKMLTVGATQAVIEPTAFLPDKPKASDPDYSNNPTYSGAYSIFFQELIELTQTMRDFLYSIVYVGPNRPYIKRFYSANDMRSRKDEHTRDMLDNLKKEVVKERVNQWLEKFEIGYKIDISDKSLSGTDILSPKLIATNSHNGLSFAFSDVGQGITHLLPIIVTLVAKRDSFIIIEDPEVH
ncbi:MAG: AAA family ATPase, partial [Candidatus Heimdallarchaeota archaeon]|nr:AAA family ATPase [Candidatus Heimdallarchaeota archaeon]